MPAPPRYYPPACAVQPAPEPAPSAAEPGAQPEGAGEAGPAAPPRLRYGQHVDFTALTIVRQDDSPGGLEARPAPCLSYEYWDPDTRRKPRPSA